jgi:flagellar motor switch protein FliN/FliY
VADNFLTQDEINALLGIKDEAFSSPQGEKNVQGKRSDPDLAADFSPNLELIMDFPLTLSVQLGKSVKNLKETRKIGPGTVLELDRFINEPVDVLINNKLIAQGEVVIVDENFGIKITHIINPIERVRKLG